jgi:poly-gamma-glutamate synthesis protein (capsule biosynthesis protein)
MLGRAISDQVAAHPEIPLFVDLEDAVADVDVLAVNLETTITTADERWVSKNYHFQLDPAVADAALGQLPGSRHFLSLANNHILDFLAPGLHDTIANLDRLGLPHAGAGETQAQARAPRILETDDGVRIAFVSAATVCSCGETLGWAATDDSPGMFQIDPHGDWDPLLDVVADTRPDVDWLVVSMHWGPNWIESWPIAWMRTFADALVDAGADVIVGHSSHHVLPVEWIRGVPVIYGPGDFIDDYTPVDGFRNDLSLLARVRLSPDAGTELDLVPLRIEHGDIHQVVRLAADDPDAALVRAAAAGEG